MLFAWETWKKLSAEMKKQREKKVFQFPNEQKKSEGKKLLKSKLKICWNQVRLWFEWEIRGSRAFVDGSTVSINCSFGGFCAHSNIEKLIVDWKMKPLHNVKSNMRSIGGQATSKTLSTSFSTINLLTKLKWVAKINMKTIKTETFFFIYLKYSIYVFGFKQKNYVFIERFFFQKVWKFCWDYWNTFFLDLSIHHKNVCSLCFCFYFSG